jgi:hypothetical protein
MVRMLWHTPPSMRTTIKGRLGLGFAHIVSSLHKWQRHRRLGIFAAYEIHFIVAMDMPPMMTNANNDIKKDEWLMASFTGLMP